MLSKTFFDGKDVETLAKDLIGCEIMHKTGEGTSGGIIVETEAYHQSDEASHSFNGQTARTRVMFGPPGFVYVYFTYGMHWCFNITAEPEGSGAAVLIRALEPTQGVELMAKRRGIELSQVTQLDGIQGSSEERASRTKSTMSDRESVTDTAFRQKSARMPSSAGQQGKALRNLCSGPAKLVQALGIIKSDYGKPVYRGGFRLKPREEAVNLDIRSGPRIGIKKAAEKPWRFWLEGNPFVSR